MRTNQWDFVSATAIKIAPGISLNLSKSGISASIGKRGMTVNVGHGKTRTTVGVPGSGMSYSTTSASSDSSGKPRSNVFSLLLIFLAAVFLFLVIH